MKDTYIFPAVIDIADDGISVEFPDLLGCLPYADTVENAVKNAKEAVMLHLFGMEEDGDEIPESTPFTEITLETNQTLVLVDAYMPTEQEQNLALELMKRMILAWDSDYTKLTPKETKELEDAEKSGYIN